MSFTARITEQPDWEHAVTVHDDDSDWYTTIFVFPASPMHAMVEQKLTEAGWAPAGGSWDWRTIGHQEPGRKLYGTPVVKA